MPAIAIKYLAAADDLGDSLRLAIQARAARRKILNKRGQARIADYDNSRLAPLTFSCVAAGVHLDRTATDLARHPTIATSRLPAGLPSPLVLVLAPAAMSAFWKSASVKP